MEVISDYLDVLEQPKFDNSIESEQYALFQPDSQNNLNVAGVSITIEAQAADRYLIPAKSRLYIEGNLRRADNNHSRMLLTSEVALVNNAMMYPIFYYRIWYRWKNHGKFNESLVRQHLFL